MKKLMMASAALALGAGTAFAASHDGEVKLGILLGYTGPIESLAGPMAQGAEMAIAEVNEAGGILDGRMVTSTRADAGCIDNGLATSNAERLIADGIDGLIGAACSGTTGAVLKNVSMVNGMVQISPSATSPALSDTEDGGLFYRTAPSDAREGEVMAEILKEHGIESIALTYTNNDFGKGLSDAIKSSFEKLGGEVTIVAAHEDGRSDYSAEVGALASAGGDLLVVAGYLDQGGLGIIRAALDVGAWDRFGLPGGMIGESITDALGDDLNGSFGQIAGSGGDGAEIFVAMTDKIGLDGTAPYVPESYDAAALFLLAMQAAGSADPADYNAKIMEVANAPGEKIQAGELDKALKILAEGGEIDYVGASGVELIGGGESAGSYREVEVKDGKFETVRFR